MEAGFLLIDKTPGPTSHDVVARVRQTLHLRRIGHTGTLDPFASGLLILCIGCATRLAEYFLHRDKVYRFDLILGAVSDTYDHTGHISPFAGSRSPDKLTESEIYDTLKEFTGDIEQTPPIYSAVKVRGKHLYEYARAGESVEIAARKIHVYDLKLIEFAPPVLALEAHVSSGTYIRSLGNDIGERLGVGAYLNSLRRIAIGHLGIKDAISLEVFEKSAGQINKGWLSIKEAFADWGQVEVSGDLRRRILNGNAIPAEGLLSLPPVCPDEPILILDSGGEAICVAKFKRSGAKGRLWLIQPLKVLCFFQDFA